MTGGSIGPASVPASPEHGMGFPFAWKSPPAHPVPLTCAPHTLTWLVWPPSIWRGFCLQWGTSGSF